MLTKEFQRIVALKLAFSSDLKSGIKNRPFRPETNSQNSTISTKKDSNLNLSAGQGFRKQILRTDALN